MQSIPWLGQNWPPGVLDLDRLVLASRHCWQLFDKFSIWLSIPGHHNFLLLTSFLQFLDVLYEVTQGFVHEDWLAVSLSFPIGSHRLPEPAHSFFDAMAPVLQYSLHPLPVRQPLLDLMKDTILLRLSFYISYGNSVFHKINVVQGFSSVRLDVTSAFQIAANRFRKPVKIQHRHQSPWLVFDHPPGTPPWLA